MIYICKLFRLFSSFIIPPVLFPIFSSGYFYFLLSLVCSRLVDLFSYTTKQTQNSFFSICVFFLIECICMLLLDESVEQSLLAMISIFTYIHIHKLFLFIISITYFSKKKPFFIPSTSVRVCVYI